MSDILPKLGGCCKPANLQLIVKFKPGPLVAEPFHVLKLPGCPAAAGVHAGIIALSSLGKFTIFQRVIAEFGLNLLAFSQGEISEALSIILALIIIEGLLSVDNALAIAAMASHLPEKQRKLALRLGILGAYVFRGLAMAAASWLMNNMYVKWIGAGYLLYLACKHLGAKAHDDEHDEHGNIKRVGKGLVATVVGIELMDLSLSVDNVVAAVGLVNGAQHIPKEHHIWVVCIGVFIGIIALRLVAGWCLKIIEKFPILVHTAFILVGYVGAFLMVEMARGHANSHEGSGPVIKFAGIAVILFSTIFYSRSPGLQKLLQPLLKICKMLCRSVSMLVDAVFWPLKFLIASLIKPFKKA